ncbi:MAG: sugar kinase [Eubacteriales bacterium]|nr:sugar kinase [Eubacteriales bacterium]
MKFDIMTIGVPMVEFVKKQIDSPLSEYGEFMGPFAAGDPGITLNACTTLGYKGCYVGVAGKDAFAECFMQRMKKSGIDTSHIRIDENCATGISMLTNFSDGSRKFLFTLPTSAASKLGPSDLDDELIKQVKWIHLSGFAISISDSIVELHRQLVKKIYKDVLVSFDPNYRKDVIGIEKYKKICAPVFERCNLFLPSYGEAGLYCPEASDELDACRRIAATGKLVALKDGTNGCYAFCNGKEKHIPSFPAVEVDPTGAGDTFGGALIAALMDGKDFFEAARYGAAAGSIAVSRVGLLDIAPTRTDIQTVLDGI